MDETVWRECRLREKISFRGTEQKTAVPCGFRELTGWRYSGLIVRIVMRGIHADR